MDFKLESSLLLSMKTTAEKLIHKKISPTAMRLLVLDLLFSGSFHT